MHRWKLVPVALALALASAAPVRAADPVADPIPWLEVAPHVRCLDLPGAMRSWIGAGGPRGPLYVTRSDAGTMDRIDLVPGGARVTELGRIARRTTLDGVQRPQVIAGVGVLVLVDDPTPPGVLIESNIVNRKDRVITRLALIELSGARRTLSAPGHDVSSFASDGRTAWSPTCSRDATWARCAGPAPGSSGAKGRATSRSSSRVGGSCRAGASLAACRPASRRSGVARPRC